VNGLTDAILSAWHQARCTPVGELGAAEFLIFINTAIPDRHLIEA
jgi:hypothetical protein